jgi:hypothetical protein
MERVKWTDERMSAMDEKFDRLFDELHALREEMREGFAGVRSEISGLRADVSREIKGVRADVSGEIKGVRADVSTEIKGVRGEIAAVRADQWAFQRQVLSVVAGLAIALIGLLGAFVAAQF